MKKYTAKFLNAIPKDKFYLCGFKTNLGDDKDSLKLAMKNSNPNLNEKDLERQANFMLEYAKLYPESLFVCSILIVCELDDGYLDLTTNSIVDINNSHLIYSYPIEKYLKNKQLMITESFNGDGYLIHMSESFLQFFNQFGDVVSEMFNQKENSVIGEIKAYDDDFCLTFTMDDETSEN